MRHLAENQPLFYHPGHTQWTRSVIPYTTFLTPLPHFLLDLRCLPGHRSFSVVCLLLIFLFPILQLTAVFFFWSQILSLTGTDFLFYFYDMHRTGKWTTRLRSKRKFSAHLCSALDISSWYWEVGGRVEDVCVCSSISPFVKNQHFPNSNSTMNGRRNTTMWMCYL